MYEELVYALKKCGYPGDVHCCRDCVFANDGETCHRKKLLPAAADAIEELQKDLERSKDFEAFWQHEAEEALKKFQVAIANKPQWITFESRPMDDEEREYYSEMSGFDMDDDAVIYCSQLPEDGQEVLVCNKYGSVWQDIFCNDPDYGVGFETHGDMDGIVAWMPMPEPYKPKEGE